MHLFFDKCGYQHSTILVCDSIPPIDKPEVETFHCNIEQGHAEKEVR